MAFHVSDPATDEAIRRLAKLKGKSLTATIREAVEKEYERECRELSAVELLKPIWQKVEAPSRPGGKPADKAFFDELSGDS